MASGGCGDDKSSAANGALRRSVVTRQVRPRFQAVQSILQISDDVIEADAPEAGGRFVLPARVRDDHDRMFAIQHRSGPCRVLAAEADVDAARQMRRRKFGGVARVENLRASLLQREHAVERQRVHARQRFVERGPLFAVQHGVVIEVGRRVRLIGRHHLDERFLAHRLQRVVRAALLAQRRYRFLAERFSAERARAVRRIHQAFDPAAPAASCAANRRACRQGPWPTSPAPRADRAGPRRR